MILNDPDAPAPPVASGGAGTGQPDDAAARILDAASRRFLHYGYSKTTMSEIAGDCNMSTGNLYRYFPSKLDIAEAFVQRLRTDQLARLQAAIAAPHDRPEQKLRTLLRLKFRLTYERFHNRPRAFELSQEILRERPAFALEWEAAEANVIIDLLGEIEAAGALRFADKPRAARLIQDAVFRFTTSAVFHEGDFEALAGELDDLVDLVLDAFAWRSRTQA